MPQKKYETKTYWGEANFAKYKTAYNEAMDLWSTDVTQAAPLFFKIAVESMHWTDAIDDLDAKNHVLREQVLRLYYMARAGFISQIEGDHTINAQIFRKSLGSAIAVFNINQQLDNSDKKDEDLQKLETIVHKMFKALGRIDAIKLIFEMTSEMKQNEHQYQDILLLTETMFAYFKRRYLEPNPSDPIFEQYNKLKEDSILIGDYLHSKELSNRDSLARIIKYSSNEKNIWYAGKKDEKHPTLRRRIRYDSDGKRMPNPDKDSEDHPSSKHAKPESKKRN